MKIVSVTFVKEPSIKREVNTETGRVITEISEQLKKSVPKGETAAIKIADAGKYVRYAMQKRLQKLGHKIVVRRKGDLFEFVPVSKQ